MLHFDLNIFFPKNYEFLCFQGNGFSKSDARVELKGAEVHKCSGYNIFMIIHLI